MSFRWPNKDPDEILDYSVDWSRWLSGASIVSTNWYINDSNDNKVEFFDGDVVNGLQKLTQTNSGDVTTIILGLGTNNVEYKLYCKISDSTGNISERVIRLRVKEQ